MFQVRFTFIVEKCPWSEGTQISFPYERLACLGRILGIIGHNPSVSKSNQLRVVILWFFFMKMRYIHRFL